MIRLVRSSVLKIHAQTMYQWRVLPTSNTLSVFLRTSYYIYIFYTAQQGVNFLFLDRQR